MRNDIRILALATLAAGAVFIGVNRHKARVSIIDDLPSTKAREQPATARAADLREAEKPSLDQQWRHALALSPSAAERVPKLARILADLRTSAPEQATSKILSLEPTERILVASQIFQDAAKLSPNTAVKEGIRWCEDDPAYALEYGRALITALEDTGDHRAALDFVIAEDAVDGWLGENAHKWMTALFASWAAISPGDARRAAREVLPANYRDDALQTIATVSQTDLAAR